MNGQQTGSTVMSADTFARGDHARAHDLKADPYMHYPHKVFFISLATHPHPRSAHTRASQIADWWLSVTADV